MDMQKSLVRSRIATGIFGTLGGLLAISWLSISLACACVPSWVMLADEVELNVNHESEFTLPNIQSAYNKKFRGQQLLSLSPPKTGSTGGCKHIGHSQLHCKNWLKTGLLWKEGLLVSFFADANGKVEHVDVSDALEFSIPL
jgi:hypothetical protein